MCFKLLCLIFHVCICNTYLVLLNSCINIIITCILHFYVLMGRLTRIICIVNYIFRNIHWFYYKLNLNFDVFFHCECDVIHCLHIALKAQCFVWCILCLVYLNSPACLDDVYLLYCKIVLSTYYLEYLQALMYIIVYIYITSCAVIFNLYQLSESNTFWVFM